MHGWAKPISARGRLEQPVREAYERATGMSAWFGRPLEGFAVPVRTARGSGLPDGDAARWSTLTPPGHADP